MALLLGGSLLAPQLVRGGLNGSAGVAVEGYTAEDLALLDMIGDTIIPETDVPGAKAVKIGAFMAMMVRDCSSAAEQKVFNDGLHKLAVAYRTTYGRPFFDGSLEERVEFLNALDREWKLDASRKKPTSITAQAFKHMKELTILGYFTSEIGSTQALRYVETPGRYDGSAPYKPGDRAWTR